MPSHPILHQKNAIKIALPPPSLYRGEMKIVQMGREVCLFLAIISGGLFISLVAAGGGDWNILNHHHKNRPFNVNANVHVSGGGGGGGGGGSHSGSLKNYCESWRMNVEMNNIRGFEVVPEECINFIGKYMTSSQYKADSERAIEESSLYLSSCCSFKSDGQDAWIFDIDDTLLSTLPYFKKHHFGGEKLNVSCLEKWMRERKAPALEHTHRLFEEIRRKGIKIFLISSRRESLRDATVDNLIKVGYHGWTSLILRGMEDEYREVQNYKAKARKRLVDEGYHIWGIIGDQWTSFEGLPAAKRTFKLPNSLYYVS